uniref:Uncharacterized protein n=1 Tax=Romanomermis culicivorax TaxID=13658 RepID=A0A915I9R0_ROMCU
MMITTKQYKHHYVNGNYDQPLAVSLMRSRNKLKGEWHVAVCRVALNANTAYRLDPVVDVFFHVRPPEMSFDGCQCAAGSLMVQNFRAVELV